MTEGRTTRTAPERIAQIRAQQDADPTYRVRNNEAVAKHRQANPQTTLAYRRAETELRRRYPAEWQALKAQHSGGPKPVVDLDETVTARLWSQQEAADMIGVNVVTVRHWRRTGRLVPSFRTDRLVLYSDADIERGRHIELKPGKRGNVVDWRTSSNRAMAELKVRHHDEFEAIVVGLRASARVRAS